MPRIRLTWREARGDLPMVCPFCGRDAHELVTAQMKEEGGRFRVLWTVHRIVDVTLPRCRRHRRSWTHMFTLHVRWIEDDYIEFANAHRDFVDAVEDYRESSRRRRDRDREGGEDDDPRPRHPWEGDGNDPRPRHRPQSSGSGLRWPVVLLVVALVAITPCLCLLPFAKIQNGDPQNRRGWPKQPPGPGNPKWR